MKPVSEMNRLEFAGYIAAEFSRRDINIVLSGGSCVSIYSSEKYVSLDLDFVNAGFVKRSIIIETMEKLGFKEQNRYFVHPENDLWVEFPSGPLAIGEEPIINIEEIKTSTGIVRILSATDCVKDRLAWYYHAKDSECLEQARLVALKNEINFDEIERWSKNEGKTSEFQKIKILLRQEKGKS